MLLLSYLRQNGFFDTRCSTIVDIGWSGRLQRSLCKTAQTIYPKFNDHLSGLYFGLQSRPASEDAGDVAAFTDSPEARDLKAETRPTMFEMFCAASHGTVTGYRAETEGVVPVLKTPGNPEAEAWGLDIQQEAVVEFTQNATRALALAGIDNTERVSQMTFPISRAVRSFLRSPTKEESIVFGDFAHAESSLHTEFARVAPDIKINVQECLKWMRNRNGDPLISFWPEASIRRSFPVVLSVLAMGALRAGQLLLGRRRA
jgi:hypothetical protein